jgi:hypothetical protein
MAARHYAQFLDASDPNQVADDDFRLPYAPAEVLRGSFRIGFIGREGSSYANPRYLLSVVTPTGHLAFRLESDGAGTTNAVVRKDGALLVSVGPITFSAGQELTLEFGAAHGALSVAGATTGDGSAHGFSWNIPPAQLRLGGNVQGADLARGYVSLPYAVPRVAADEGNPGTLDFSGSECAVLIGAI